MDGLFLVDKPFGWSSHKVVAKVKKRLGLGKVGHAGTLDPAATGLLVLLCGKYTKKFSLFQEKEKEYEAEIFLGEKKDTLDQEGETVFKWEKEIDFSKEEILKVLSGFKGKIEQIPPRFSAVKVGGVPAYKLARKGKKFELEPKKVEVYKLDLEEVDLPKIKVRVVCSSGTYIRALARDIGEELGVGAYLSSLRRTRIGSFRVEEAKLPHELTKEDILSEV